MSSEQQRRHDRAGERTRRHPPPPAPEPLAVPVLDSHTHLDLLGGDPDRQIDAARAAGVDRLVQVGVDVTSSRWAVELAQSRPPVVAAVGIHPNEAPRLSDLDGALRAIEQLAAHPRVRGIGETGLDTFRTGPEGRDAQEAAFRAHIAVAKRYGRPLIVHDRDAHADILRIFDQEGAPDTVVMHCFSGDAGFARECARRGFVLSFSGTVTFRNAPQLRDAARTCPTDQMLVETDAPYLAPVPYRGRPNAPYLIPLTVRALAGTIGIEVEQICTAISGTGERVFGPWSAASAGRRPAT